MSIDITQIVIALIGLMSTVITAVMVPLLKAHTNADQQAVIACAAKTAVYAAQQLFGADEAQKKKEYALANVTELLKRYGITADTTVISLAVEAALKEIKAGTPADKW